MGTVESVDLFGLVVEECACVDAELERVPENCNGETGPASNDLNARGKQAAALRGA